MSNKKTLETLSATLDIDKVSPSATNSVAILLQNLALKGNQSADSLKATPEIVEHLAASGISVKNICGLFNKSFQYLTDNPTLQEAFERGRAQASSRLRSTLLDAALNDRNIQSAIYLDKIMSGDNVVSEVNINVAQSQLSTVSDDDLMKVAFTVEDETIVDEEFREGFVTVEKPEGGGHTPGVGGFRDSRPNNFHKNEATSSMVAPLGMPLNSTKNETDRS